MTAAPSPARSARTGRVAVNRYRARDGSERDIELAYDVFGERGRPLVLVMGIGAQRIFWDVELCEQLVARGFVVVRLDNRDVGESTHLDAETPKPWGRLAKRMIGLPISAPYTLSDMAQDVVGLVDALALGPVHVVGASLGGMVAQHLAIEHASHLRSMTSIMSTPGSRRYLPKPYALRALFAPVPRTATEAGEHMERVFTSIGSRAWPVDGARLRAIGEEAHRRGMNPRGFLRQFAAVAASGDRRRLLPAVAVPTLVVHGTCDPMFPLEAGRATARLVQHGTWLPIAGMGHDLPPPVWPAIVAAVTRHAERADAS